MRVLLDGLFLDHKASWVALCRAIFASTPNPRNGNGDGAQRSFREEDHTILRSDEHPRPETPFLTPDWILTSQLIQGRSYFLAHCLPEEWTAKAVSLKALARMIRIRPRPPNPYNKSPNGSGTLG